MIIDVHKNDDLQNVINNSPVGATLSLEKAVYKQKVEINKSLTVIGNGATVTFDDYAKKLDEKGVEYNTFRTYTVAVLADNVTLCDLVIENSAKSPEVKGQEVALSVIGDNFVAKNCTLVSTQDTLFCGPLPFDLVQRYDGFLKDELRLFKPMKQVYENCTIVGTVDFIFGTADALFENCTIVSSADKRGGGFVCAPAHSESQQIGFVFDNCNVTCESDVESNAIFLARPWRDYGKASFVCCRCDRHVKTEGFDKWNDTNRDKTARFGEFGNVPRGRVAWSKLLTQEEVKTLLDYFKN